jgi:tetratricopeptide (TPR) repeat protein
MAVTTENQLSPTQLALYKKARSANDIGNHGYVIQLMQSVLKEQPNFLDGRKLVRAAALAATQGKKSGMSLAGTTLGLTASSTLKKDPLAAIEIAEKTLATDPRSVAGNQLLFEAAKKAEMLETASFALETLVGGNAADTKIMHQLADHYIAIGESDKAVAICNRILQVNPKDLEATKKGKDASAAATMKSGGWDKSAGAGGTGSFRDLIKNQEEAKKLEDKGKVVRTVEQITGQIADLYPVWEENQSHVDNSKKMAVLYEQLFEVSLAENQSPEESESHLDSAVWYFSHTNSILNGGDPNIQRKYQDLLMKKTDRRIAALEEWLAAVEDKTHPEVLPYVDELNNLREQRATTLLEVAKKRVDDNPTDLLLRYEYGEVLMKAGKFTDAIPELQRARQNPNVRLKAMNLLGQCFVEKSMLDLAASTFKGAASELIAMDNLKKEITYKLAMVLEKMGKKEEYIEALKQIYEVDYGYLDVAQRVESSYGS